MPIKRYLLKRNALSFESILIELGQVQGMLYDFIIDQKKLSFFLHIKNIFFLAF
jgi:hypothetical protein